ncbi:MAG: hypothetical protein HYV07_22020 [Deltaproteobacteria bacterium]|nr:hypothetical protein [Deltaproteobacteria bacterium]
MISSALVGPLVRPLIAGRSHRSALSRTARSSTALVVSLLAAFGPAVTPARAESLKVREQTRIPAVHALASELGAELPALPALSSLGALRGALEAPRAFDPVLSAPRFRVRRLEVLIPDPPGKRIHSQSAPEWLAPVRAFVERCKERHRREDAVYRLFGSGTHRSALPA